jgi:hypothetical protein
MDVVDPLLWYETHHLLTGSAHRAALSCLDGFLQSHAEGAIQQPLKRAISQRDLWAIFDWAVAGEDLLTERRDPTSYFPVFFLPSSLRYPFLFLASSLRQKKMAPNLPVQGRPS